VKRQSGTPKVLARLYGEHRYLSALVHVLEEKTGPRVQLKVGDFYLLRDIVGYVHDYPDHVHHPTEDLLFERLLKKDPTQQPIVERLRRDHRELDAETRALLERLDALVDGRSSAAAARSVLDGCRSLAKHQRAHMRMENTEAFPVAIATLSAADWRAIETRFLTAEDPLFGNAVKGRHRLLYEYLLDYAEGGDYEGVMARLLPRARLASLRGVLLGCGADLWKMWTTTARGALAAFMPRR
jgi:hemerythrin-like domain-containing protein